MFQAPAVLDKITTLKDGSLKVVFETQELGKDSATELMALRNKFGWLVFAGDGEKAVVPDEPPPEFRDDKSPSQRLRASLYRLWESEGKKGEFESWYRAQMERVIRWVQEKIGAAA